MYAFVKKHHRYLFFCGWLIINLIQAWTTELFDDEAYYWVYSKYLAWGYFDHPPMIAMLIKAGYGIFRSELGVRLLVVLLNTGTVYLISKLIDRKSDKLFYAIALSVAVGHVGGMIAVPDVPLLFFVTLFFLLYKRFAAESNVTNSIFLAIGIALMLYTKYHGVLVVFFTLLSNPKLFLRPQTYIVAVVSVLLFAPHLYWQYANGYPSVKYHLFERNARSYEIGFTAEYILTQVVLAGPFVGWLLLWTAFRFKAVTDIERAYRFSLIGFYLFFLLSTLKGRVEANWTLPAFVPLIVLSHQYLVSNPRFQKWIFRTLPLTILVVILARVYMMISVETKIKIGKDEFRQNREWVNIIRKNANGLPVVFVDSYQRPSKYWFYAQQPALGLNTPEYRRNNFNFWPIEQMYYGKQVFAVSDYDTVRMKEPVVAPRFRNKGSAVIANYFSFMKSEISDISSSSDGTNVSTSFKIVVPQEYLPQFQQAPSDSASIILAITNAGDSIRYYRSGLTVNQITARTTRINLDFELSLPKGEYMARLGITSAIPGDPSLNSTGFKIQIK